CRPRRLVRAGVRKYSSSSARYWSKKKERLPALSTAQARRGCQRSAKRRRERKPWRSSTCTGGLGGRGITGLLPGETHKNNRPLPPHYRATRVPNTIAEAGERGAGSQRQSSRYPEKTSPALKKRRRRRYTNRGQPSPSRPLSPAEPFH